MKKARACGNFRGQLKKRWNFQGCSRKTHVEFTLFLVFGLGIFRGGLVFSEIPWVKWLEIPGGRGGSEKYILDPPPLYLNFFWNSPFLKGFFLQSSGNKNTHNCQI